VADSPENQPKNAGGNHPDAIDQRLATVAAAVRDGQLIERHWEFFRTTHFPGMDDREAGDTLFAWAERNGVRATLHQSLADADETPPRATHVRLSPRNYWGPPLAKSEPGEAGTLSAKCAAPRGEYVYDAIWERRKDTLIWSARVQGKGRPVRVIDGQIYIGPGRADLEAAVRRLVEGRITRGEDVD